MDEQGFQALTEQVYAAVFDDDAWSSLLTALRHQFDASVITTMAWDQADVAPWLIRSTGSDADADRQYTEYYHAHDQWRHAFQCNGTALQQPLIVTDEALVPREIYLKSEMYHGFSRRLDVGRGLFAITDLSATLDSGFSIHRPAHMPEFDRHDVGLLKKLAPHLKRGLHLHRQMSQLRARTSLFASAFDALGLAIFLLDATGRIVMLNEAARRHLDAPQSARLLALQNARLTGVAARDAATLENAIQPQAEFTPPAEFTLYGASPAAALRLTVTPLKGLPDAYNMPHGARVSYLVTASPLYHPLPVTELVMQQHGLTRTEAEVAQLLAQGLTPTEIAARRGKSLNTIKAQVRQIYAKTGVAGQAALLAKLLGVQG